MTTHFGPLPFVKKCCCNPPCPPLSYCKCDNDNSDLPCVAVTFDDATPSDELCSETDPDPTPLIGQYAELMADLEGEFTIGCDSELCIVDQAVYACDEWNSGHFTPIYFFLTIKAWFDAGTSQVSMNIYLTAGYGVTITGPYLFSKWVRKEARVVWQFPISTVDGCPYRSCTPELLSTTFGSVDYTQVGEADDGVVTCDEASDGAVTDGTATTVTANGYTLNDLLPDLSTMTFGIATTTCP